MCKWILHESNYDRNLRSRSPQRINSHKPNKRIEAGTSPRYMYSIGEEKDSIQKESRN